MNLVSTNIENGVYHDSDFFRDFSAAMEKAALPSIPTKSNRDKSGFEFVKKGLTVDYFGVRFYVQRVRLGICYGETLIRHVPIYASCSTVKVVK